MTAPQAGNPGPLTSTHRLWGGRFADAGGPAAAFEALNNSIAVDFRLWPFDVEVSKAWAESLHHASVLSAEEWKTIDAGLCAVAHRLAGGERPIPSDEDVHTLIDRLLHVEAGEVAAKLHTGRSRNDQIATTTRLWAMDATERVGHAVCMVENALVDQAERLEGVLMPSYTHMQRAIPVSAAHWLLSHFWPLERDRVRLGAAHDAAAVLPLGSGAVAGCAYPISRPDIRDRLGFASVSPNSIDAVGDRDFLAELLFTAAMIGMHLSRLAEDMIMYGSSEFAFIAFGDTFTSGSSMMPQKRNPDALELARGSASRILGDLVALLGTLKGLPSSYNKDLQDDKRIVFGALDTLLCVLPAVCGALAECAFRPDRMRAAISSTMMATDLADHLVRRGASFRDAHRAVGGLVRDAEGAGEDLHTLPLDAFRSAHPLFDREVFAALSASSSVDHREIVGGTGPTAVRAQLVEARRRLRP